MNPVGSWSSAPRLVILVAVLACASSRSGSATPPELSGVGSRWTPILVEKFDGPALNESIWTVNAQDGRPNGNNGVTWGWHLDE